MTRCALALFLLPACELPGLADPADPAPIDPSDVPRETDTIDETDPSYPEAVDATLDLPWPPFAYDEVLPETFATNDVQSLDNTPNDNPITSTGATLGRVLFYDPLLSSNETVACASCHDQAAAFTDPAQFSEGFEGGLTGRNSMSLLNVRYYDNGRAFWDERANSFEAQALLPIQDPIEMGVSLEELVSRVSDAPYYPRLFEDAFGDATVTDDRIADALAQFVRSILSYRSEFDAQLALVSDVDDDFPGFTDQENRGKDLFMGQGRCDNCHLRGANGRGGDGMGPGNGGNEVIFQIGQARNNGLDADSSDDQGAGRGEFKSPSLRSVALTAPYMHDGRFDTLEEVIEFYNAEVQDHPNLHPTMRGNGGPRRLNLSAQERAALVAFLETLTDEALLTDPRFSDPFR